MSFANAPRFFVDTPLDKAALGDAIELNDAVRRHWCKALRAKKGDRGVLFDGQGGEYHAILRDLDKNSARVLLAAYDPVCRAPAFAAHIGLAVSRADRMDYAIQKATELGVASVRPLISARSQPLKYDRDRKKIAHWQSVAIAACEQCGLNRVPKIHEPLSLDAWTKTADADLKLVLTLNASANPLPAALPKNIALLIGPEGGLSDDEIACATGRGFAPWTIGDRTLRAETAPVAALSVLNWQAQNAL